MLVSLFYSLCSLLMWWLLVIACQAYHTGPGLLLSYMLSSENRGTYAIFEKTTSQISNLLTVIWKVVYFRFLKVKNRIINYFPSENTTLHDLLIKVSALTKRWNLKVYNSNSRSRLTSMDIKKSIVLLPLFIFSFLLCREKINPLNPSLSNIGKISKKFNWGFILIIEANH